MCIFLLPELRQRLREEADFSVRGCIKMKV